jgi:hypothetical protein
MNHAIKIKNTQIETPSSPPEGGVPAIAVVIRNGNDTPRGAWFGEADFEAAAAGATAMGMYAIKADTPEIVELTTRLPQGRIFESGKLFTPMIQASVYDQLIEHVPAHAIPAKPTLVMSDNTNDGDDKVESGSKAEARESRPTDWSQIKVGSMVLAEEAPADGWFEAIVLEALGKNKFQLRWRDYPDEPLIIRHFSRMALMMQQDPRKSA